MPTARPARSRFDPRHGQILSQMPIALRRESVFRDTFTSYLHRAEAA
jgi:hypothetical protein